MQSPILEENGSVSEPVVRAMIDGALHLSGADIGVAVSGIAGPDGGTDEKPLGTVWFAWGRRDGTKIHIDSASRHFEGDREAIRELTVAYALQGVLDRLQE